MYQYDERLDPPRCREKQSEQYTGRSPRGWNGTLASWPHSEHTAEYIVLSERPYPPPPPP
jgi:hypothetical protein